MDSIVARVGAIALAMHLLVHLEMFSLLSQISHGWFIVWVLYSIFASSAMDWIRKSKRASALAICVSVIFSISTALLAGLVLSTSPAWIRDCVSNRTFEDIVYLQRMLVIVLLLVLYFEAHRVYEILSMWSDRSIAKILQDDELHHH